MSDVISREAAIEAVMDEFKRIPTSAIRAKTRIEALPSAQPESDKEQLSRLIRAGIIATDAKDVYSCGMRNGMRWCRSLLDDKEPKFEDASQYAQQERKKGKWINIRHDNIAECDQCGITGRAWMNFCFDCGADMRKDGAE